MKKILKILAIILAILIACFVVLLICIDDSNFGGLCKVKYSFEKAIVLKKTISNNSLKCVLAYKLDTTTFIKDTLLATYTMDSNADEDDFKKLAILKVNDTITYINCKILRGTCTNFHRISLEKYTFKKDTIESYKEK